MKHGRQKSVNNVNVMRLKEGRAFGQCTKALSWQHIAWIKHHDLHSQNGWRKQASEKKKINKLYRLKKKQKNNKNLHYYGSIIIMIICPI